VVAVNTKDGSIEWSWTFPWPKELENGALLEHGGLLLVFGWQHHGSFPTTAVLAALDTSSGKLLWQYQLDLPMGTMMSQWSCEVTLRLADNITLEYVSPKEKKYPSRRLVLDRASGKIISEGAL
jgi:outer membrane protein assembly factor BamB